MQMTRLQCGDRVVINGKQEEVDYTYFDGAGHKARLKSRTDDIPAWQPASNVNHFLGTNQYGVRFFENAL